VVFKELLDRNAIVGDVWFIVENGNGVRGASGILSAFMIGTYETPRGGACANNEYITA